MTAPVSHYLVAPVNKILAELKIPGCSVAVVTRNGAEWQGGFGLVDIRGGKGATGASVYHLFSATKLFTAVAVLQLEERGLLALEDPVQHYVPAAQGTEGVTLLHLLSHQSGLRDTLQGFLSVSFKNESLPTSARALERYRIDQQRPPGVRVEYRNVNFALLGEVISRVSGCEYRDYLLGNVIKPLGMNASFSMGDDMRSDAATGYMRRWDPMWLVLRMLLPQVAVQLKGRRVAGLIELNEYDLDTSAIGGLVGSMPEFAKFLRWQLTGEGSVLSSGGIRRMQSLVARGAAGIESRYGVGLGWKVGRVENRFFLNHEGAGAGFTSELRLYPEAGIGIALGMNVMQMPKTMRAAHRICEAIFAAREQLLE